MSGTIQSEEICCPEFQPEKWEKKKLQWIKKTFVKDNVKTFFHMPFRFGKTMERILGKMESSNVSSPEWLSLCEHTSMWNMDVYVETDGEVKQAENVEMSGEFYCRVYEGPYKNTGQWCANFENDVYLQEKYVEKMYMWYVYCPKCAKKYGKNYVAIIGKLGKKND
jgi:Zn-dependent oligopeptidase